MNQEDAIVSHVSGEFDVSLTTLPLSEAGTDAGLGRRALDKRYHGALDASAKGEMLSAGGAVQGSAGYVAIEKVQGVLGGRSGSFLLLHSGIMTRGMPLLSVTVIPDSGTGELVGLTGKLSIRIDKGRHFYEFEYSLAASASGVSAPGNRQ